MKKLFTCLLAMCILLSLVACSNNEQAPSSNGNGQDEASTSPDGQGNDQSEPMEITIAIPAEPSWLDAAKNIGEAGGYISRSITEYLVTIGNSGTEYMPMLAERWEQVDDGWVVYLRQGVKFHNGENLTAEDVIASYERIQLQAEPNLVSENVDSITSMEAIDDYTVKFTTNDAAFMSVLCAVGINPKDTLDEMGADEFSYSPIGTGPYKFVEWIPGERITLEAYEGYWGEKADIETVNFRFIPEASTRVAELVSGGIDVATNLNPEHVTTIESSGNAYVASKPSSRVVYYLFNRLDWGPEELKDPLVCQALNYAVNKQEIIDNILNGQGIVVANHWREDMEGYNPDVEPFPYDPEKAKELLAEAGYPDGFTITMQTSTGAFTQAVEVGQAIASYLADVGVTVDIETLDYSTLRSYLISGQDLQKAAGLCATNYGGSAMDCTSLIGSIFRADGVKTWYQSKRYQELVEGALASEDSEERVELLQEFQAHLMEDHDGIYLYQQMDIYGVSNEIDYEPEFGVTIAPYLLHPKG